MRLFAIGDTHLSFGRPKPMDIFGERWRDHVTRLAANWDRAVGPDDVVLVAGDVSWGQSLAEAAPDLAFLAERRGRLKLLLRGNHDSWWASAAKLRAALPPGLAALHHDAVRLPEGIVVCGARGWNLPTLPYADPVADPPIFERELARLDLSLKTAAALRQPGDALVAMLHYPPLGPGETDGPVVARLAAAGVQVAVYGHLHGEDHAWAPAGTFGGIALRFVAADAVDFTPVEILSRPYG